MLSSSNRLTSPVHFREVVRRGRRRGGQLMVLHFVDASVQQVTTSAEPRIGFVVSRAVGPAVTRNLVKRRLRHLARERLHLLSPGSMLVVRALPGAARAGYEELGQELDRCLVAVSQSEDSPAKAVIRQ